MNRRALARCLAVLSLVLTAGCSSPKPPDESSASAPQVRTTPVSMKKDDYPVFPDKDAGADAAVPAEQGGKGFTGEGWETNASFDFIGDPRAVKGGVLRDHMISFPGTLRMAGPEWNNEDNYVINSLVYEGLLNLHPTLRWYDPAQRVVYLNKFGMPQGGLSRVGDYNGTLAPGIPQLWWVDPEKSQKLDQAMRDNSIKLDVPPEEDHYWQERYGLAQKEMDAQSKKK